MCLPVSCGEKAAAACGRLFGGFVAHLALRTALEVWSCVSVIGREVPKATPSRVYAQPTIRTFKPTRALDYARGALSCARTIADALNVDDAAAEATISQRLCGRASIAQNCQLP